MRLSGAALTTAQMLYGSEAATDTTLGFWRFEAKPDVLSDASGHGHNLARPASRAVTSLTPAQAALGDFCQSLLNASEFLYTE